MAVIELKEISPVKLKDLKRAIDRAGKVYFKGVADTIKPIFRAAVEEARSRLTALFHGKGKRLRSALVSQVRVKPSDVEARFGYIRAGGKGGRRKFWFLGRFYERGVTIKPKRRGSLWVPIGANRGKGGDAVLSAAEFFSSLQGRSVVKLTSRGNLVAFERRDRELVPLFVLKKVVVLQPRPVVTPMRGRIVAEAQKAVGLQFRQTLKT